MDKDLSLAITDQLLFRRAAVSDIPDITLILRTAAARMLAEGKQQWDETYPGETDVRSDVEKGFGHVLESGGEIAGYAAVVFTGEPAYAAIDGNWLTDGRYVVAHRVAVSQRVRGRGMGIILMKAIEEYSRRLGVTSFRIDTNFDNEAMLGLLDRLGFTYCGEIAYEKGVRKAFEKPI